MGVHFSLTGPAPAPQWGDDGRIEGGPTVADAAYGCGELIEVGDAIFQ